MSDTLPAAIERSLKAIGLVSGLPVDQIVHRLETATRVSDYGQRSLAFYLHEMDAGRLYQKTGHASTAHFAEMRLHLDKRRALELVAVGRTLRTLPAIDRAFCQQRIGWSKVLLLVRVASHEHEAAWLALAEQKPCRELALQVKLAKPGAAPRDPDDMKGLPEPRFQVQASVGPIAQAKYEQARRKLSDEVGRVLTNDEVLEAMTDLVLQVQQDGTIPGMKRVYASAYRVILHQDEGSKTLFVETEDGLTPVPGGGEVVCDAEVLRAAAESIREAGEDGHEHEHVRAPKLPEWLRLKILARDGYKCRSCGSRRELHVHHIRFREDGGGNEEWNLSVHCRHCHAMIHAGLLVLVGERQEAIRYTDRQGRPLDAVTLRTVGVPDLEREDLPAPPPPPPLVTLDSLPATIDGRWWLRHRKLLAVGGKVLELKEGRAEAEPAPAPGDGAPDSGASPAAFDPSTLAKAFERILGQEALLERIRIAARGSRARGHAFPHTLLSGPAGVGKSTIAQAIAAASGRRLHQATGGSLKDVHQLLCLLAALGEGDVLFLEEAHAVPRDVVESLYEAMTDRRLSLTIRSDAQARAIAFALPAFTVVAATTEDGDLPAPFLSRFVHREFLAPYEEDVLAKIVLGRAHAQGFRIEQEAAGKVAAFSRGRPREAIRLLEQVLDAAASAGEVRVTREVVDDCFRRLGFDDRGLNALDQRALALLRRAGRAIPLGRLATLLGANVRTLLREVEPMLLSLGLIEVTPLGRRAVPNPRPLVA